VLPPLVRRPHRKLATRARRLGRHATADDLHRLRIRAKRARYAADVAAPVVGRPARRLAKRLGSLTDVLGDLHDLTVAETWLRAAGRDDGPGGSAAGPSSDALDRALVAGLLIAAGRREERRLRKAWWPVWRRATAPAVTSSWW